MTSGRIYAITTVILGLVTLVHAVVTWPIPSTLALFGGGALIAFVAEVFVIHLNWLEHHIDPKVLGVPVYLLFGWTGVIYLIFRMALLITDGWMAVAATGVLATTYDILTDHQGVENGHWMYQDEIAGPRYRDVPWWNFLGWLFISSLTAAIAIPFL